MAHNTTAQQGLDQHAVRLVRHKARQLIRRPEFTASDRTDIEQELFLDLLTRLPRFDATRAKRTTFVDRVVNNRVATLLEARTAAKRNPARCVASLDADANDDEGHAEPVWATLDQRMGRSDGRTPRDDARLRDLRFDVGAAMSDLPEDLRDLAGHLSRQTPTEVARANGVPRRTVRDRIARIRGRFERAGLRIYLESTATSATTPVGDQ